MLNLIDLTVHYERLLVLKRISMAVSRGEFVAVIGGNGAGKSTLVKTISGLTTITSGQVLFQEERIDGLAPHQIARKGISLCPERWRIASEMTILENLELGAYLLRNKREKVEGLERVFRLFPILKQRLRQEGGTLSGGERQMLSIGRALMARPKFLMLDEISLGIAPILKENIYESIRVLKGEITALLVEQDTPLALGISERAYIMENGQLIREGEAKSLLGDDLVRKAYLGI